MNDRIGAAVQAAASIPTACPGRYGWCRCQEHALGLLVHTDDPDALLAVLAEMRPTRRVSAPAATEDLCDGTYTCSCMKCVQERAALVLRAQLRRAEEAR